MATDKPRFTITLDPDTLKSVLDYKQKNKLSTQSKAIQRLIELGISDSRSEKVATFPDDSDRLSSSERKLVSAWRRAAEKDRRIVAAALEDYGFSYQEDGINAG